MNIRHPSPPRAGTASNVVISLLQPIRGICIGLPRMARADFARRWPQAARHRNGLIGNSGRRWALPCLGGIIGGEGKSAEIDAGYFGGYVKPVNRREDRRARLALTGCRALCFGVFDALSGPQ